MKPYFEEGGITIYCADAKSALLEMPSDSVQCCVTSPPYWGLRDYGVEGQIGLEENPLGYTDRLVDVFREVRRVLRPEGTLWLNLGDSYATSGGSVGRAPGGGDQGERFIRAGMIGTQPNRMPIAGLKPKDLVGIPWRVAFALQADGWYLRSDIIWHKPNPMPESVTDRPTKSHEYLFLMSKSEKYFYDAEAISEPIAESQIGRVREDSVGGKNWNGRNQHSEGGVYAKTRVRDEMPNMWNDSSDCGLQEQQVRAGILEAQGRSGENGKVLLEKRIPNSEGTRNKRSVWTINTAPFPEAHFATFPEDLVTPCIKAGTRAGDTVLDPFSGAATVGVVARRNGNPYIGIELNPAYCEIAANRLRQGVLFA